MTESVAGARFILSRNEEAGSSAIRFLAFDTAVNLVAYGVQASCETALLQAHDRCRQWERLFSRTLPHSDISCVNNAAGKAVGVDPATADLVQKALHYCEATSGLFDITMGALTRLWDMKARRIPNQADISEALTHVDWRLVEVGHGSEGDWVRLGDPAARLDLGGIAKGWMADELGVLFKEAEKVSGYLIDLGGNIAVGGSKPDGRLWRIGIRMPETGEGAAPSHTWARCVDVDSGSVVTSGVYERCFMHEGVLYHHIIDPRTGYPAQVSCKSATAVCTKSIDAEGFSTALLMLGPTRSQELIAAHDEIRDVIFL